MLRELFQKIALFFRLLLRLQQQCISKILYRTVEPNESKSKNVSILYCIILYCIFVVFNFICLFIRSTFAYNIGRQKKWISCEDAA